MSREERRIQMQDINYDELAQKACIDEDAFEKLYEHFFPRIYNFIYARLKNSADADDVTSITFMKMNENLNRYEPTKAAFSTWLFRIANNAIIDHTRRSDKDNETEWDEFFDPAAPEYAEPEAQILESEGTQELLTALKKLQERERHIIEMKFFAELDSKTIASILSMSESNVRVTLHRTLTKLKKILELKN